MSLHRSNSTCRISHEEEQGCVERAVCSGEQEAGGEMRKGRFGPDCERMKTRLRILAKAFYELRVSTSFFTVCNLAENSGNFFLLLSYLE